MICGNCGAANSDGTRFCVQCGMYLSAKSARAPIVPPEVTPASEPDRPEDVLPFPAEPEPDAEAEPIPGVDERAADAPATAHQPSVRRSETVPAALEAVVTQVEQGQRLAVEHDRPDLAEHLEGTRTALTERTYSVAVIGEFKQGKSTLVNALLQRAVCPVDADIVTAVPTSITYSETPYAKAHFDAANEEATSNDVRDIPLERLEDFVSESGTVDDRQRLRMVEVGLPHRLLQSGLCLVDTPGLGGLESAQGVLTMSTLREVQGALFVTDASQELTEPEVEFLKDAAERCPSVTVVITKIDLYLEWRRIVEINRRHLERAGLQVDVIPVSSFLRLRSRLDPELTEESGFRALIRHLASAVVGGATATAASLAASEVRFVTNELARQVDAERSVIEAPEQAERVVEQLESAKARSAQLTSSSATWQQLLTDGIQDLTADVEHDLQRRLRLVVRDTEAIIDESDPHTTWTDTEVWLRRQVAIAALENRDLLSTRTSDLVSTVAGHFDLDAREIALTPVAPTSALEEVSLASSDTLQSPTSRLSSSVMAARFSVLIPTTIIEIGGGIFGFAGLLASGPIGIILGAGVGYKLVKGESRRQVAYRRQQGKSAVRRYVDEVAFLLNKDCRDTLRATQRTLRDEFQQRAMAVHRSSSVALAAAQAATSIDDSQRARRAAELNEQSRQVRRLSDQLVGAGAPGRGGHV